MAEEKKSIRHTIMERYNGLVKVGKFTHDQMCKIIGRQLMKDHEAIGKIIKKCKAESARYPSMDEYMKTIERPTQDESDSFFNLLRD